MSRRFNFGISLRDVATNTPLSDTIWRGQLDENKFGKGPDALPKLEDNLEKIDDYEIRDRRFVFYCLNAPARTY